MSHESTPSGARTFLAVTLCAAAYLYAFPFYPQTNNPNENVRMHMTAAIVENHTYEISAIRKRWGWTNDAAVVDKRVYSVKAPGTSLLGVPGYWAYHRWLSTEGTPVDFEKALHICRITASVLPMLLFLIFFHRWLGKHTGSPVVRDAAFFSVALGSLLYAHAITFTSSTTSAICAFGAFMLIYDARERSTFTIPGSFMAGLLAAGVTFFEYPGLVASILLTVYAFTAVRRTGHIVGYVLGGLIPTLAVMHFQWRAFGSPITPGHLFVENPAFRHAHEQGLFGATVFHEKAAVGLLFDPGYGLIPLTPILFFGFVGFLHCITRYDIRTDAFFAFLITSLSIVAICFMNNWRGGWTMGPRYIAIAVPFMAWAAVVGLDWMHNHLPVLANAFALGALMVGITASGIPSVYYPHIPPEITRPLPQLFSVLITHDFAPHNFANDYGYWGTLSMVPLFVLFFLVVLWTAAADWSWKNLLGYPIAILISVPLYLVPANAPSPKGWLARIIAHWDPKDHDLASRLATSLIEKGGDAGSYKTLVDLYTVEGRKTEAKRAQETLDMILANPELGTAPVEPPAR